MKKKVTYETVEVDLDDDQFLVLAKMAHERDITFNQLCNEVLREYFDKIGKK